jgi:hypothetical protein
MLVLEMGPDAESKPLRFQTLLEPIDQGFFSTKINQFVADDLDK